MSTSARLKLLDLQKVTLEVSPNSRYIINVSKAIVKHSIAQTYNFYGWDWNHESIWVVFLFCTYVWMGQNLNLLTICIYIYMRGHGAEALSSPLPGKQTKGCGVSATHCTQRGADGVCNTLVPETGPPFWKPFLLPAILRPHFWGWFLAPFLGPWKSKQELLDGPDGPDFVHLLAPAFLLQCKPPWTHTQIHIVL